MLGNDHPPILFYLIVHMWGILEEGRRGGGEGGAFDVSSAYACIDVFIHQWRSSFFFSFFLFLLFLHAWIKKGTNERTNEGT